MREILFRGKSVVGGHWFIGDLSQYTEDDDFNSYPSVDWIEVVPETVGQFTGLYDEKGRRIFEGDIVDEPRFVVTYCADLNEDFGMNAGWYLQRDNFESWTELDNVTDHVVLGNIHDDPELLGR